MNLKLNEQKNTQSFTFSLIFLSVIIYGISFVFAKESKIDLGILLGTTSILLIVMSLLNKNKEIDISVKKLTIELLVFMIYFIMYFGWSCYNSIYNLIPADDINLILLLVVPFIITKAFGYDFKLLGFELKQFFDSLPIVVLLCAIIGVILFPTVFMENIRSIHTNILGGVISYLLVFVMVFILSAIPEEFFFRTILQTRIEKVLKSPISGIIVSSLIFAIYHIPYRLLLNSSLTYGSIQLTIFSVVSQQFLMGLFLGLWWKKTRNVYSVSLLHAFYNAFFLMNMLKIG
jgi:membrane protease YdiL (CAAX protease family)